MIIYFLYDTFTLSDPSSDSGRSYFRLLHRPLPLTSRLILEAGKGPCTWCQPTVTAVPGTPHQHPPTGPGKYHRTSLDMSQLCTAVDPERNQTWFRCHFETHWVFTTEVLIRLAAYLQTPRFQLYHQWSDSSINNMIITFSQSPHWLPQSRTVQCRI